ncbi:hypothetical protein P12x_002514 [Tundrisphaera lichenicola]|uniref:hypothetical protein n=1 Tax=Tundrisphaera lichenicola TaxID=2029860 RepID=UPI003EBC2D33
MSLHPSRRTILAFMVGVLALPWAGAWAQDQPAAPKGDFPSPEPIPQVTLGPTLKTHPIQRNARGFLNPANGNRGVFNEQWVDAAVLPRDRQGIWVLDFAFKPLRLMTVVDEKGRRDVHYMYYQVVNKTGEPRFFVPQFTLVTDTGMRYEDAVLPQAVKQIQLREDPSIQNLHGAVEIVGMVPPSTKQGIDDAVFGVAIWEGVDPKADKLSVFVRGLSDGYREEPAADGGKPLVRYKSLQIDFIRRGDEHDLKERELILDEPPFEWTYR